MKAILVVGLGFGDEGKGSIVDSLVRETGAPLVVRFNGGAQAAHHVVTDDGREHCFAQFGSGTLAGARTYLSQYMMIDPTALLNEAQHLIELGIHNPLSLLTVHPFAPILTPYHMAMNRLREISRGPHAHGSCGIGIGELASDIFYGRDYLTAHDLWVSFTPKTAQQIIQKIQARFVQESHLLQLPDNAEVFSWVSCLHESLDYWLLSVRGIYDNLRVNVSLPRAETTIFEGAQGILLDEKFGFAPYTTWSNCTFENALTLLQEAHFQGNVIRIGVIRSYMTRHGNGPFPTEGLITVDLSKEHNTTGRWQGNFRVGCFDENLVQYAVECAGGLNGVALTHIDQVRDPWPTQTSPGLCCLDKDGFLRRINTVCHAPIMITSSGPTASAKNILLR